MKQEVTHAGKYEQQLTALEVRRLYTMLEHVLMDDNHREA
jgi:hypothetical protein